MGKTCVKCGAWKGQLGHEPDPELFVSHLADIFDEVKRVLKKTGNCFIIIGDTYAGGGGTTSGYKQSWEKDADHRPTNRMSQKIVGTKGWIKRKQLLLIPYRLAIELQMRGWIIRDMIVWAKAVSVVGKGGEIAEQFGNGLPESCRDRLTKSQEIIIHAVKSEKYYFNKPKTQLKPQSIERMMRGVSPNHKYAQNPIYGGGGGLNKPRPNVRHPSLHSGFEGYSEKVRRNHEGKFSQIDDPEKFGSPRARLLRSNSKFLKTDMESNGSLAGRVIRNLQRGKEYTFVRKAIDDVNAYLKQKLRESGYSIRDLAEITGIKEDTLSHYFRTDESGACLPSREVWEKLKPVLGLGEYEDFIKEEYRSVIPEFDGTAYGRNVIQCNTEPFPDSHFAVAPSKLVRFLMKMGCPEGGVVLDPFMGAGTTAMVAEELNRRWVGVEINSEYAELIKKRVRGVQKSLF